MSADEVFSLGHGHGHCHYFSVTLMEPAGYSASAAFSIASAPPMLTPPTTCLDSHNEGKLRADDEFVRVIGDEDEDTAVVVDNRSKHFVTNTGGTHQEVIGDGEDGDSYNNFLVLIK